MIKALLLDLDGTLLDDEVALAAASATFYDVHRERLSDASFDAFLRRWRELSGRHWKRFMAGELDFAGQRRERVREVLRAELSDAEADAVFAPHDEAYQKAWCCYADVTAFLAATRSLKKIAVTNGDREQQRSKMAATGLLAHVSELVTPADARAWKPDPAIFSHALQRLGVTPAEAAMVGDDYEKDIAPAAKLGLRTVWIKRTTGGGLSEVKALLAGETA